MTSTHTLDHIEDDHYTQTLDDESDFLIEDNATNCIAADEALIPQTFLVDLKGQGTRLDKFLATALPSYSRGRIQQWIEAGAVTINGRATTKVKLALQAGMKLVVIPQAAQQTQAFLPEDITLDVIYQDDSILIINKPPSMVVHPAAGNWSGTLLNGLLHFDEQLNHVARAGIVHRLDKDTSGLMVVARTEQAQTELVRQLQARSVKREYLALAWGIIDHAQTIDASISRHLTQRTKMAVSQSAYAKTAITHIEPLAQGTLFKQVVTLVRCRLETGRTHQIRVHLAHLKNPLVGDPLYGRKNDNSQFMRQALHAERLGLIHPTTHTYQAWQTALPQDMLTLLSNAEIALTDIEGSNASQDDASQDN